jgi:tetratricopeptide (TPR) repeat protein
MQHIILLFKKRTYLLFFIIAALTYINTAGHEFVFDDYVFIETNPFVLKGIKAIPEIFQKPHMCWYDDQIIGYRPLQTSTYALFYQLFGMNPLPGHLYNILLYALGCMIAYIFLKKILIKKYMAEIAILFFILHPLHTDVTANIKSIDELLAFIFSISALLFYLKIFDSGKHLKSKLISAGIGTISFTAAMFSKESAVTMIAVLPLVIWFFRNEKIKNIALWLTPFILTMMLYLLLYSSLPQTNISGSGLFSDSFDNTVGVGAYENTIAGAKNFNERSATTLKVLGKYLSLTVFPHPLIFDYSYNQIPVTTWSNPSIYIIFVVLLLLTALSIRGFFIKNPAAFGVLFFFISFAATSNIIILIGTTVGERFLFTPLLGFCIALSWLLLKAKDDIIKNRFPQMNKAFVGFIILIMSAFAVKTITRNLDWKSNYSLFMHDLAYCQNNSKVLGNAGVLLFRNGEKERGIASIEKAIKIYPNRLGHYINLGSMYTSISNFSKAIETYKTASLGAPNNTKVWSHLGVCYMETSNYSEAATALFTALGTDPKSQTIFNQAISNLMLLQDKQAFSEAVAAAKNILSNKPVYYMMMAHYYQLKSDNKKNIKTLIEGLNTFPGSEPIFITLSTQFHTFKNPQTIIDFCKLHITGNPASAPAHHNIAFTYERTGKTDEAIPWYYNAIERDKKAKPSYFRLFNLLQNKQKFAEAIELLRKLAEYNEDSRGQAYDTMAKIYFNIGDYNNSRIYFDKGTTHGVSDAGLKQALDNAPK